MKIALAQVLDHLSEKGADDQQLDHARRILPALVETRDHAETLEDLGVDVGTLTSADIPGPNPDGINPEITGPVGAPDKAESNDPY
ncbi:MAG: hypothetical protein WD080_03620 [Egibacteraceae bacterium]